MGSSSSSTMEESTSSFFEKIPFDNSWIAQLSPETPENYKKSQKRENLKDDEHKNQTRRPVFNGHYVLVPPTGLTDPQLLLVSSSVGQDLLGFTAADLESPAFVQYVSGNLPPDGVPSWATPYALSIMGTRYTSNCPYGTGHGYGDGRALSIGEFRNHELQLKGAGPTPLCRGADGRAVLRSSIREFLASEAMHALGIGTTRALSLVVSTSDQVGRPWYSPQAQLALPAEDDPRLAEYTPAERKQILAQLRTQKADPNVMVSEPCAIACRVSPSFVRIGHLDLFARRVLQLQERGDTAVRDSREYQELEAMVWHACYREFRDEAYTPFHPSKNLAAAGRKLLELSADRLSTMVAEWLRVGFAQGNFNADNCLVGGRTMDYGPFGFMEEYSPDFAKWTGSGKHFGFLNQPQAGVVNYQVLVESVVLVLADNSKEQDQLMNEIMDEAIPLFRRKVEQVFRRKLGFPTVEENELADQVWDDLRPLLQLNRVDWTLFWRQLTKVAEEHSLDDEEDPDYEAMMVVLEGTGDSSPFYEPLSTEARDSFVAWLEAWRTALVQAQDDDVVQRMRLANPKYVLREWMLKQAYNDAKEGDMTELQHSYELIQRPYQEGTSVETSHYYRRTPDDEYLVGGTAFMS